MQARLQRVRGRASSSESLFWAGSSAAERRFYTANVAGSIPVPPTLSMSRRVPSSRFDDRRAHALAFACVVAAWFYAASAARADQPRDFMLSIQPPGTFLLLDYFGTGAQATLENRIKIYRDANDLTTGVSLVPAYPLAEANARADLRILFFSLGGTVAYRSVWRDLSFAPGKNS